MYFGVMLPVFLLPVALFAIVAWRVRPSADLIVSFGVAALVAAVGFSILGIPYMRSRGARGERDPRIVTFYSAVPSDYGTRTCVWLHIDGSRATKQGRARAVSRDRSVALALIGMLPPTPGGSIATIGATALAFDGSLGNGGLVYDDLYRYLVPFRGMRVPARFSALVGCGLALLGAYGARRLINLPRDPRGRTMVFGALVWRFWSISARPWSCTTTPAHPFDLRRGQWRHGPGGVSARRRLRLHLFLDIPLGAADQRVQRLLARTVTSSFETHSSRSFLPPPPSASSGGVA